MGDWLITVPYVAWCKVRRLFRVKRQIRMDKILRAELDMKTTADNWAALAKVTTDPTLLYTFQYRASNARQMEKLLHQAWSAEYNRRPIESQALRDQVVELYQTGLKQAAVS